MLNNIHCVVEIADVTGVSEPTVRSCWKDMETKKYQLLPPELLKMLPPQKSQPQSSGQQYTEDVKTE